MYCYSVMKLLHMDWCLTSIRGSRILLRQEINYYQLKIGFLKERHYVNSGKNDILMTE